MSLLSRIPGDYAARREERRRAALATMAQASSVAPCAAIGMHVGILVGLEREGLCKRLPERDRVGDLRFAITEAGRAELAA